MTTKKKLIIAMGLAVGSLSSHAWAGTPVTCVSTGVNTCVYTFDAAAYGNAATVTFNNWGYVGPNGTGVNDFQVGSGFNSSNIGQRQNVTTSNPDWLTSDPALTVIKDPVTSGSQTVKQTFYDASVDATVNFYAWAYTTVGGSTFTDMKIDKAGNYSIAKNDMSFQFYDVFQYHDGNGATNGLNPDSTYDTRINFKPYAISDARGWCGSVLTSDPNSLEQMAGQVTFDVVFDVYVLDGVQSTSGGNSQLIPNFVMRSYGDYVVESDVFVDPELIAANIYRGSAVGNNTNPESAVLGVGGTLDPAWQNKVSFLGAGVIPKGVWVTAGSYLSPGVKKLNVDGTWDATLVDIPNVPQTCDPNAPGAAPEAGAVCWQNTFAGFPFLMRADGERVVTYINPEGWTDYAPVPVPAAVWLFGGGLLGLAGLARRKK